MFPITPTIPPGKACEIAGIDKPDRLRSWHIRDELHVGQADRSGARRLYSLPDVAILRLVNDLTRFALPISIVVPVVEQVSAQIADLAIWNRTGLIEGNPVLVITLTEPLEDNSQRARAEIVYGSSGEAGVAAMRSADGEAMSIVFKLAACILRTQRAYGEAYPDQKEFTE